MTDTETDLITKISDMQNRQHRAALREFEELIRGLPRETLSEDEFRFGLIFINDLGRDVGDIEDGLDLREGAIAEWLEERDLSAKQRRPLYHLMLAIIAELQDSLGTSETTLPESDDIATERGLSKEDAELLKRFKLPEGVTLDTRLRDLPGWEDLSGWAKNAINDFSNLRELLTYRHPMYNHHWMESPLSTRLLTIDGCGKGSVRQIIAWLKDLGIDGEFGPV